MSLSCVTDKERVASILAWKEIHTASDLNLMVGGEIKSHGQRGGKQFFDDGYRSRELLAWSLPKLAPVGGLVQWHFDLHLQKHMLILSLSTQQHQELHWRFQTALIHFYLHFYFFEA
jgi:hypothetical protein